MDDNQKGWVREDHQKTLTLIQSLFTASLFLLLSLDDDDAKHTSSRGLTREATTFLITRVQHLLPTTSCTPKTHTYRHKHVRLCVQMCDVGY